MRKFFKEMGLKKFRQNSSFLFILADVWILGYIYKKFTNKETIEMVVEIAAKQHPLIDKAQLKELYLVSTPILILMLVLIAIVHLITYVLYNKNKLSAFAYLNFYSWSAGIGCILGGVFLSSSTLVPGLVFIATGGAFIFNAIGLRVFPHEPEKPKKN